MNPRSSVSPAPLGFTDDFSAFLRLHKILDDPALQRSLRAAHQSGERFDHVLTKLGLASEDDVCLHLADYLQIPGFKVEDAPAEPVLVERVSEKFFRDNGVLPLFANENTLTVAVNDPFNTESCEALAYAIGLDVERRLATPAVFEKTWASLYGKPGHSNAHKTDGGAHEGSEVDLEQLRDIANEAPVVRRVNQIAADAIEAGASDIHIEPTVDGVQVRYRIDGAMRVIDVLPPELKAAVASRIKIMARMDIAQRRLPQDGRIKLAVRGVDIDFRVSTIPTVHGESVVLRILDRKRTALDFTALGFEPETIVALRDAMKLANGIVLVTGPTGSGKTTTLYTALRELARPEVKIFTVEDPVEYQLSGTNQVQVQAAIGLDFPSTLRSILRQDPDIIMIGEIRDAETARIAIQASLTGHLVFSTLHTNSAASSITRLIDMGVEPYLIASTVKAVLAQRLVRRLCLACSEPLDTRNEWRGRLQVEIKPNAEDHLAQPKGCPQCRGIGYSGRSTIAEMLVMNDKLKRMVCQTVSDVEIEESARQGGMTTMYQCGMTKAWRGETCVDEVMRVTRVD